MLKIPITIVLSVVIFVIVVAIMLLIFASPECDSMANTTAYNLKVAIDEVSKDSFYSWDQGGVPPDGDLTYYRTVPIKLCQDKGISQLEILLGTTLEPQYKIYYERFPEGGGGTWTEAYPWSGGAAATLRIWAYMRVATFAFKATNAALMTRFTKYTGFMNWLGGLGHSIRLSIFGPHMEEVGDDVAGVLVDELGEEGAKEMADTSGYFIVKQIKGEEYLFTVDEAIDNGIINGVDDSGKIVISRDKVNVLIPDPASYVSGEPTQFVEVYAKYDSAEHIIDMSTDTNPGGAVFDITDTDHTKFNSGWNNLKVEPSEMYKDWLNTLSKEDQAIINQIYTTEQDIPFKGYIAKKIKGTGFYQNYLQPVEDKLNSFLDKIGDAGYRIDRTVVPPGSSPGVKLAFVATLEDPTSVTIKGVTTTKGDLFAEEILGQTGVKDKIRLALGLATTDEVTKEHLLKLLQEVDFKGMVFLPNELEYGIHQAALNKIVSLSKIGGSYTGPLAVDAIFRDALGYNLATDTIVDADSYKIIQDFAQSQGITEVEARLQAYNFINYDVWSAYGGDVAKGKNVAQLTADTMTNYFTRDNAPSTAGLVERLGNDEENAAKQAGLLVGTVTQNKDVMSMTPKGRLGQYFKAEAKKIIYLDGPQNIINPDSFWARALFANLAGAGCKGNSICLYSYTARENPIYLNETAEKYFLRVWRPVSVVEQWALWQAALKHVPEHPRFYVVSPCLATAKIWKTTYNGQPTIFINMDKVDLGDSASNYCYADSNLINSYVAIWFASDTATLVTTVLPFLSLPKTVTSLVGKIIGIADPITLTQGIVEGAISWPGQPFKTLTWQTISANTNKIGIKEIEKGAETQK